MKRIVILSIVLILSITGTLFAQDNATEKTPVFRNLYWGDPLSMLGEVQKVEDAKSGDELQFYQKVDENLHIGPYIAKAIVYSFFNEKLMSVIIYNDDAQILSDIAKAKYGEPIEKNMFVINETYATKDSYCTVEQKYWGGQMILVSRLLLAEYGNESDRKAQEASKAF